jgi:hypothetical protein
MDYQERNQESKGYLNFRNSLDLGMGAFYLIIGIILINMKYFGNMELSTSYAYILGGLMLLYGGFRIYRGIAALRKIK